MPGHCQTRQVNVPVGGLGTLIQKNPCDVDWIVANVRTLGTKGYLQIFDGFDNKGMIVWEIEPGYSRHNNFRPPIVLHQGLFIYASGDLTSFTVCFCPLKAGSPPCD